MAAAAAVRKGDYVKQIKKWLEKQNETNLDIVSGAKVSGTSILGAKFQFYFNIRDISLLFVKEQKGNGK